MDIEQQFRPNWISPPGDTISEILREKGIPLDAFSLSIGRSPEYARQLLEGKQPITLALARQLQRNLGGSVEFWMARDFQYSADRLNLSEACKAWITELPIRDMWRFGWLDSFKNAPNDFSACLDFFGVQDPIELNAVYSRIRSMVALRTSPRLDSHSGALTAWLRQGERVASAMNCKPWNADLFRSLMPRIRELTCRKDPRRFLPELESQCAEAGVAVVIVRAPEGCRASGATRFVAEDKALLQLSFRYLTDDHFWFTFFHEAGHLLLHGRKRLFLEDLQGPEDRAETRMEAEEEANDFAATTLVPLELRDEMMRLTSNSKKVIRFAVNVGTSPGIIVGQLQHFKRIPHNQLNGLKRKYEW